MHFGTNTTDLIVTKIELLLNVEAILVSALWPGYGIQRRLIGICCNRKIMEQKYTGCISLYSGKFIFHFSFQLIFLGNQWSLDVWNTFRGFVNSLAQLAHWSYPWSDLEGSTQLPQGQSPLLDRKYNLLCSVTESVTFFCPPLPAPRNTKTLRNCLIWIIAWKLLLNIHNVCPKDHSQYW